MQKKIFKKLIHIILASIILVSCSALYTKSYANIVDSGIDYTEETEVFSNPDRGFYRPMHVVCKETGTVIANPTLDLANNITIRHMRFDIKTFGKSIANPNGKDFTKDMLDSLDKIADNARKNGVMLIVRFAYDYDGNTVDGQYIEFEPGITQILRHVNQLEPFFQKNEDIIISVESGFFGPWGEQHSTSITKDSENFNKLINALLDVIPESISTTVRTPKIFANYVGINISNIDTYVSQEGTKPYRVGIYNDGYLGSGSDLGTYSNRIKEINWIKKQASHTLFGGEVVLNYSTDGYVYNSIEHISKEMYDTHTSYLNIEWNNTVINEWKSTIYQGTVDTIYNGKSGYIYVNNHLGYRFVIRESKLSEKVSRGNEFELQAKIENVGAGNVIKEKETTLIFVKDNIVKHVEELNLDVRDWASRLNWNEQSISDVALSINIPEELELGTYKVYLKISNPDDTNINRSIRFANANIWNLNLGANYMGSFEITEEENFEHNALYIWNHDVNFKDLKLVKDYLNLNSIYQSQSRSIVLNNNEYFNNLISFCDEFELDVYTLSGDTGWYSQPNQIQTAIDQAKNFNRDSTLNKKIKGVILDVEYYTRPEWSVADANGKREILNTYIQTMKDAYSYAKNNNLEFALCIPWWLYSDYKPELEIIIKEACDFVEVMNYRKERSVNDLAETLELAKKHDKRITSIAECMPLPGEDFLTFYPDGINACIEKFNEMRDEYKYDKLGFAYHYYIPIVELVKNALIMQIEEIIKEKFNVVVENNIDYIIIEEKTTIETLLEELDISDDYIIEIKNINGTILTSMNHVGTGSTITIKNQNNEIMKTYTVVVKGDVTGDGTVNFIDIIRLIQYVYEPGENFEWVESIKKAGKVSAIGVNPGFADIMLIIRYCYQGIPW